MTAFVEHFVKVDSSWQSKLPKGTPNDAPLGDDCVFLICVHSTAIAYSAKEAQLVIFGLPSAILLSQSCGQALVKAVFANHIPPHTARTHSLLEQSRKTYSWLTN